MTVVLGNRITPVSLRRVLRDREVIPLPPGRIERCQAIASVINEYRRASRTSTTPLIKPDKSILKRLRAFQPPGNHI
jgi:hypothetical protein